MKISQFSYFHFFGPDILFRTCSKISIQTEAVKPLKRRRQREEKRVDRASRYT
jgi:hypothetical protein